MLHFFYLQPNYGRGAFYFQNKKLIGNGNDNGNAVGTNNNNGNNNGNKNKGFLKHGANGNQNGNCRGRE